MPLADPLRLPDKIVAKFYLQPPPIMVDVLGRPIRGDCWVWTGEINRNGYGRVWIGGKRLMWHRATFDLYMPDPGPALPLRDHLCRVRACGCPDHVEPVTHAENTRRGEALLFGHGRKPGKGA